MARRVEEADVWLEPVSWDDRRERRRVGATLTGTLRASDGPQEPVTLLDLSASGCRVRATACRRGDRVRLHLTGLDPIDALVAWVGLAEAGLEVRRALRPEVVARLTGASAPSDGIA